MPLPAVQKGEEQSYYISRCISFETKAAPGREPEQVQAMCYQKWRDRGKVSQSKKVIKMKNKDGKLDITNVTVIDLKAAKIDTENNIIHKMSIMTNEAHDTDGNVFRQFSNDAMNDALSVFNGAIARVDHDHDVEDGRGVKTGFGVYKDIAMDGGIIYGDLHLWDCPEARKVLSIAQRTPDAVGNSIHTGGISKDSDDGIEHIERLLPRNMAGSPASVDLVEDPASVINMFQNKRKNNKVDNERDNQMEFKDLTQETIKTNRPDLEKIFLDEGMKSRDKEVQDLIQERDEAVKKYDEIKVQQEAVKHEVLVNKLVAKSELPGYAKTEVFHSILLKVKEVKDGDNVVTVEDGIKSLIQDRIESLEPHGVTDNEEKDLSQSLSSENKGKIDDRDFQDAFGRSNDGL